MMNLTNQFFEDKKETHRLKCMPIADETPSLVVLKSLFFKLVFFLFLKIETREMGKTQRRIFISLEAASVRDGQSQLQKEQSKVKRDNKKYFPKRRQKLVTLTHSFEKVSRRDKIRTLGQLDYFFFPLSLLHSLFRSQLYSFLLRRGPSFLG